jgi:uncharacterized membrane-anchored protein
MTSSNKPQAQGLHVSRLYASLILLGFIVACIVLISRRATRREETA